VNHAILCYWHCHWHFLVERLTLKKTIPEFQIEQMESELLQRQQMM
jgi:hypothetical protein